MSNQVPTPSQDTNLSDEIVSGIRVAAAAAAGFGATQLVRLGVHVDPGLLVGAVTAVLTTGYYGASRYLEKHFPWAERLLLLRKPTS